VTKKLERLEIKRSKWLRKVIESKRMPDSYLFDRDTKGMCCLGFYARKLGYSTKEIENIGAPEGVHTTLQDFHNRNKFPAALVVFRRGLPRRTHLCNQLIKVNDGWSTEDIREAKITKLFRKMGVVVTFTGKGYPKYK